MTHTRRTEQNKSAETAFPFLFRSSSLSMTILLILPMNSRHKAAHWNMMGTWGHWFRHPVFTWLIFVLCLTKSRLYIYPLTFILLSVVN